MRKRLFMYKKNWLSISLIFIIMLGLNLLTPLCFGDDYVYAFIWPGQSMYVPLPETVQRVSSFQDILLSQWSHYCTGNGRMISHLFVQFFVWQGKTVFNFANALVFVSFIGYHCWLDKWKYGLLDYSVFNFLAFPK